MRTEVVARRTFWAAFSGSVGMLIAARASMGIGGAMMMPATLSIITGMFRDPAERQRAIGFWAGTTGVGIALGPIVGGLVVLAVFCAWERASSHPMLNLRFFRRRRFSAAVCSVALVTFGLFGALFVLTQYLQFSLGYSALQAGVRVLPAAGAIAVIAPLSAAAVRVIGTKLTAAAGLLAIAAGLWQVSASSIATTYTGILPGLILLGVGPAWPSRRPPSRSWARCPPSTPASAPPPTARSCRPAARWGWPSSAAC